MSTEALRAEGLTKVFGRTIANDHINLTLNTGEILAIIGENGAGKSTFCKMLTGVNHPDGGKIFVGGKEVKFNTVQDSINAGISMVYQERNLVPMLTGAQNIGLNITAKGGVFIDEKEILRRAEAIRDKLNLNTPLEEPIENLGAGEQQLIEIMRALVNEPRILILDEPTASLGKNEIDPFLQFIKELKTSANAGIIFISHKIEEVYAIADKIAVFTDGKNVTTKDIDQISQEACIQAMLRSGHLDPVVIKERDIDKQPIVLRTESGVYDHKYHSIPFTGRAGEVVGFFGQVGSGRTEFAEYLTGIRKTQECSYEYRGEKITNPSPLKMINRGMIMIPEKRSNAIFRTLSLVDNICSLFLKDTLSNKMGFVNAKKSSEFAIEVLQENNVKYSNVGQPIINLSGGNMQKLIIGRSVRVKDIAVLILDEPTTGMDIGAKNEVYIKCRNLAEEKGLLCLFISSELDELLTVSDRICVFADGNLIDEFSREHFEKKKILETAVRGHKV